MNKGCEGCNYLKTAKMKNGGVAEMCTYHSLITAWECVKGDSNDRQKRVSASVPSNEKGKTD